MKTIRCLIAVIGLTITLSGIAQAAAPTTSCHSQVQFGGGGKDGQETHG